LAILDPFLAESIRMLCITPAGRVSFLPGAQIVASLQNEESCMDMR